jgi:polar amino acid transport system substrate-binding protein
MSITTERQAVVDFTNPYFYFKIITLVNLNFATTHNLNEDSTIGEIIALTETLKQQDNYDVKFAGIIGQVSASIPQSYGKVVVEYDNLGLAIENVATGQADLLLMSPFPVVSGNRGNPTTTMVIWTPWVSSPIGMAVAKGNTALLEQANAFIDTFTDEGGLYDVLRAKWDDTFIEGLGRFGLDFYINAD